MSSFGSLDIFVFDKWKVVGSKSLHEGVELTHFLGDLLEAKQEEKSV